MISLASNFSGADRLEDYELALHYSTGQTGVFGGTQITSATAAEEVAELILRSLPTSPTKTRDDEYVRWYIGLLDMCESHDALPVAYSDSYSPAQGWQIVLGSGVTYPDPPPP